MTLDPVREKFARYYVETGNASEAARLAGLTLKAKPTPGMAYVYLLVSPLCGSVIYVGKGKGGRLCHHVRDAKAGRISGRRKHQRIMELLEAGTEPKAVVLQDGLTDTQALRIERQMIARLRNDRLCNSAAGASSTWEIAVARLEWLKAHLTPNPPAHKFAIHDWIKDEIESQLAEYRALAA